MADQEQALAAAASMHGHQMTGARHRRGQIRPAGPETERLELARVDGADTTHTGEVLGCALYVDGLLEELDGGCAVRVDCGDDALFLAAQVAARRRGEKQAGDNRSDGTHGGNPGKKVADLSTGMQSFRKRGAPGPRHVGRVRHADERTSGSPRIHRR